MKKYLAILFFVVLFFSFVGVESARAANANVVISYSPAVIMQGDPFLVSIGGATFSKIKKLTFDGVAVTVFSYQNAPTALVGVDLRKKPGIYKLTLTLSGGQVVTKNVTVSTRPQVAEPLGIPLSLGGNTTVSQDNMVAELVAENKTLTNIKTFAAALWTKKFILPLSKIFVTDPYGYSRETGAYSIPHKGVDYRAAIGTPVMAINRGIVRVTQNYSDYGNTIVIDHGLGVMSFYLHLSKINVKVGQLVQQGQVIALSGDTGYTLGSHLHLSVRIGGISIDPVKFFALFQ
jgi:murein DD-endopeptidase MepM/ murein hydrolase activator NlpD